MMNERMFLHPLAEDKYDQAHDGLLTISPMNRVGHQNRVTPTPSNCAAWEIQLSKMLTSSTHRPSPDPVDPARHLRTPFQDRTNASIDESPTMSYTEKHDGTTDPPNLTIVRATDAHPTWERNIVGATVTEPTNCSDDTYETSIRFPVVLHRMISEISVVDPTMMHWSPDGKRFCINQSHPRFGESLRKYFLHGNFDSLRRQFYAYQFIRVQESEKGYWHREDFTAYSTLNTLSLVRDKRRHRTRGRTKQRKGAAKRSADTVGANAEVSFKSSRATRSTDEAVGSLSVFLPDDPYSKHFDEKSDVSNNEVPNVCATSTPLCTDEQSKCVQDDKSDTDESVCDDEMLSIYVRDVIDNLPSEAFDDTSTVIAFTPTVAEGFPRIPTFSPISVDPADPCSVTMRFATATPILAPTPIKAYTLDISPAMLDSPTQISTSGLPHQEDDWSESFMNGALSSPFTVSEKSVFTPIFARPGSTSSLR